MRLYASACNPVFLAPEACQGTPPGSLGSQFHESQFRQSVHTSHVLKVAESFPKANLRCGKVLQRAKYSPPIKTPLQQITSTWEQRTPQEASGSQMG